MTFYLFGAGVYCTFLLLFIFKNQQHFQTAPISWLIIFIASTFWVFVIPISILEMVIKGKSKPYGRGKSRIAQETPQ
jgi:RsiW-degrading membrane proteinase PrsW (M82 family)